MVIKMLTRLERGLDELSDNYPKEIEIINKNQSQLKNTNTGVKNTLKEISIKGCRRIDQRCERQGHGRCPPEQQSINQSIEIG